MRILGAPQRMVDAAAISRLRTHDLGVDVVADAHVPLIAKQGIKTYDPDSTWLFNGWKAGVYDRAAAVCPASLTTRDFGDIAVAFAPAEIDAGAATYIPGEAVYGGLLFKHFGHFLLETTCRLWWTLLENFQGPIVFQNTKEGTGLSPTATRFFQLLGLADRVIVADRPLRFDRMIVPHRALTIRTSIHPHFQVPFRLLGMAAERHARAYPSEFGRDAAGVYLSRALYPFRRSFGERRLENLFLANDFNVVYMETLPLEQQILVIKRHKTIAGIAGSAFHTMPVSDVGKEAIYICRDYDINTNFFMIDELMGNEATYIFNLSPEAATETRSDRAEIAAAYREDATLDVRKIRRHLAEVGLS